MHNYLIGCKVEEYNWNIAHICELPPSDRLSGRVYVSWTIKYAKERTSLWARELTTGNQEYSSPINKNNPTESNKQKKLLL
jgi:hypothetical protein